MLEIKCPKCGKVMEWCDTTDVEGSIVEGWITETMIYYCKECNKEAEIVVSAPILNDKATIEVKEIEED